MTQTATEERIEHAFLADFSHRWLEAWNKHDGNALAQLVTEDVDFFDPAIGTVHGRPPVAEWVRQCDRAFPDYHFEEPEPGYVSSDRAKAIVPWVMRGTNSGPIDPPGFAPTGRAIMLEGVDHWWFRDGLVCRYRADYDSLGLMRQLGIVAPPGSRGERAMVAVQRLGARFKR
ncbi:MAG TPA: nuclear transport factor 2 family protein [Thermoleophilaceae bacterium]|jgi:steroid delta-isomerase-like uncharacterized protein